MVKVQYLSFLHRVSTTALKAEAGKIGNAVLELVSTANGATLRVTGFVQEAWTGSGANDHLDIYVHQDLIDDLEAEVHQTIGAIPAHLYGATNPRLGPHGPTRLFYVFDRSEIDADRVLVFVSAPPHGPAEFEATPPRVFVEREVPQRGRGFRARVHIGVAQPFRHTVLQEGAGGDVIEIQMSTQQAQQFAAALQYVIDEHRDRNR